jgi:protein-disulfide isomerase
MKRNSIASYFLPVCVVAVVIAAVFVGVALSKQEPAKGTVLGASIESTDLTKGNPDAKIQLIEYADFSCPACASYDPMIRRLLEEHGDWIHFAYRHLPLKQIHPNATKAAQASEAALKQSKFWEYSSILYSRQAEWSFMPDATGKFQQYALELGLDESKFLPDMESDEVAMSVDSDYRTALEYGFNSTPTFVVNGEKINNPKTYDEFVALLRSKLGE